MTGQGKGTPAAVLLIEDDPYDAELTTEALGEIRSFPCAVERAEDEFAVLGLEEAEADFSKIRLRLQQNPGFPGKESARPYRLSFSMGFVQYDPEKPEDIDELLARADKLMYLEKSIKKPKRG